MALKRVAALIGQAARDTSTVNLLKDDPRALGLKLGLTSENVAALESASTLLPDKKPVAEDVLPAGTLFPPQGSGSYAGSVLTGSIATSVVPTGTALPGTSVGRGPVVPSRPPARAPVVRVPDPVPSSGTIGPGTPVTTPLTMPIVVPRVASPPAPGIAPWAAPATRITPAGPLPGAGGPTVEPGQPIRQGESLQQQQAWVPQPQYWPCGQAARGDSSCCEAAQLAVVALVSTTAITAVTAIAALRGEPSRLWIEGNQRPRGRRFHGP